MNLPDRRRIFEIIEKDDGDDLASHVYDISMIVVIILSLLPLAFKNDTVLFRVIDKCAVVIFIIDYLLNARFLLSFGIPFPGWQS